MLHEKPSVLSIIQMLPDSGIDSVLGRCKSPGAPCR